MTTPDEFFAGQDESRLLFEAVRRAVEASGPAELRVSNSQVSFRRRKAFVWVWMPGQYLRGKTAPFGAYPLVSCSGFIAALEGDS